MPATFLAPVAALLYLLATGLQLLHVSQGREQINRSVFGIGLVALLCHAVVAWDSIATADGVTLGFYKISALIFLIVNVACIISLARRPLQNLLVILFPLSGLSVLVSTYAPDTGLLDTNLSGGMFLHICSSILAYAVLTLAAIQAALVAVQDHQLRNRHTQGIVRILPALQLMETMLFELLWIGVILLTLTLLLSFTGYLLPWDQLAFWAITVGTEMAAYVPFIGDTTRELMLGGPVVGASTLLRFYVLHVAVLPLALVLILTIHLWRWRKDSMLETRAEDDDD